MATEEFRRLLQRVDRSSVWDAGDEQGALHFVGPAERLAALGTVRAAEVIGCAAAWHNRARTDSGQKPLRTHTEAQNAWLAVNEHLSVDLHGRDGMTHLDALGHFFYEGTTFGGARSTEVGPDGVSRHSVATAAGGILARGVLLDLPQLWRARAARLPGLVTVDEVTGYLRRTGVQVRSGDVLFVRAGRRPAGEPFTDGLHIGCADWLHDSEVSVVVTDHGLDSDVAQVVDVLTPWHVVALTRMGVRLVDLADLEPLAAAAIRHGRSEFLTVLAPLPLHGATSSPINPLAIF